LKATRKHNYPPNFQPLAKKLAIALFFVFGILSTSYSQTAPVAGFTANTVTGCSPMLVNFTDQSTGGPLSWQWNLGNGSTSTDQNPSTIYTTPGTYTVSLTVTNASGTNTLTRTAYITVNPAPVAEFTSNTNAGCFPLRVQFSDLSIPQFGTITSWNWSFGTGATSTQQNPSYTYTTSGNYFVSLTVTNSAGCSRTMVKPAFISVSAGVRADFNPSLPLNCTAPETINFTNLSTGPGTLTYQWDFGDLSGSALQNPSHTYLTDGPFTVRLITSSSDGCIDTVTKINVVQLSNFQPSIGSIDSACVNAPVQFTNTSTPGTPSSVWEFGDGSTSTVRDPLKTYTAPGIYTVRLINQYGTCTDTAYKTITILPNPVADFQTTNLIACDTPHVVNFQNLSTGGISYLWDFGDGSSSTAANPTHTYTSTGSYSVTLIVSNPFGCSDTLLRTAYINVARPVMNPTASPREGCRLLDVSFQANSTSIDGITGWFWNFGDGTTSTLQNPMHTYDSGSYSVLLRITTALGCSDSIRINTIRVGTKPTAAFGVSDTVVCAYSSVQFTDSSTGLPDQWIWDFGDGDFSTDQNPIHMYRDTGLFEVQLFAFNNRCPDTSVITRYVQVLPPIADFLYNINCSVNKRQVLFTDRSIAATSWFWEFGDGSTSSLQNPSHSYAVLGTYTVRLTVQNGSCTHSLQQTIQLVDELADFTANTQVACKNTAIQFTGVGFTAANIVSYYWDFGDGATSSNPPPVQHTYTTAGNYTVLLATVDINGCRDTVRKTGYMRINGPLAGFTLNPQPQVCSGSNLALTNISVTDGVNAITTARWDMGDGNTINSLLSPLNYSYSTGGTFSIQLFVTDAAGCSDSITQSNAITVLQPRAAFSVDSTSCPGALLQFTNQSTGGTGAITYFWEFDDGVTSNLPNPQHAYTLPGTYIVRLITTEPIGCADTATQVITVRNPVAAFTVNDTLSICNPFEAIFTNNSIYATSSAWEFGDGFTSILTNPSNYYIFPGTYVVTLIVRSPGNCADTAYQTIRIGRDTGTLSYPPSSGCAPLTVNFQLRTDVPLNYTWDFGDGTIVPSTDSNQTHVYGPGFFVPKVIISDPFGCAGIIQATDTIRVYGSAPNFGVDRSLLCDNGTVQFIDSTYSSDQITSYLWDFGDGNTSNSISAPTHTYTDTGLYNVSLTVHTLNGCINSITKNALVRVVASPQINIIADTSFCVPANIPLQGQLLNPDSSLVSWQWNIDGQLFGIQNPPGILRTSADTIFATLVARNRSGCSDTAFRQIVVHPIPRVFAGNDTAICLGSFAQLNVSGAVSYVWNADPTLSCTNCSNTQANPVMQTQYVVTGTSQYGCVNRDSVIVRVKRPFNITVSGGDTICIGDQLQLFANGAENYLWTPAGSLNNAAIANPLASPTTTTTYQVLGYDSLNCFRDSLTVEVIVYPYPTANAGNDTIIVAGASVLLQPVVSADVISLMWDPPNSLSCISCLTPVATPFTTTTYRLAASNEGGCITYDQVKVSVLCNRNNIYIPNAFTPNGDNVNDKFYVLGPGLQSVKSMRIYNRWGNLIYEKSLFNANDRNLGWDGTMNGQKAPPGVYTYAGEVICGDGGIIPVSGIVTLIR
jgi:gliding motility-associated-like protein